MAVAARASPVGRLLREWRRRRNLSQFQLAAGSAVSARHLSFIETGRTRPSREMVIHLADRLGGPVRDALERFLAAHEPYPAVVVDRRWNLVLGNDAVAVLTEGVAPDLLEPPANALREI